MFYENFLLPQVKRWAISNYKHGMHELPHEFPNNLRFRALGNSETSGKCLTFIEWLPSTQCLCQNESFVNTYRKLMKNRN